MSPHGGVRCLRGPCQRWVPQQPLGPGTRSTSILGTHRSLHPSTLGELGVHAAQCTTPQDDGLEPPCLSGLPPRPWALGGVWLCLPASRPGCRLHRGHVDRCWDLPREPPHTKARTPLHAGTSPACSPSMGPWPSARAWLALPQCEPAAKPGQLPPSLLFRLRAGPTATAPPPQASMGHPPPGNGEGAGGTWPGPRQPGVRLPLPSPGAQDRPAEPWPGAHRMPCSCQRRD